MLVITRTVGESFRIGDDVDVLVAAIAGASVKLGVEAPQHVQVHRKEVYERISSISSQVTECYSSKLMCNLR